MKMQYFNDKQTFYLTKQELDQCLKIIQSQLFQYTQKQYMYTKQDTSTKTKQIYEISVMSPFFGFPYYEVRVTLGGLSQQSLIKSDIKEGKEEISVNKWLNE
jgi:hypothetical protein